MELENKEIINYAEQNGIKASPQVLDTIVSQNSIGGGADWEENNPQSKSYVKGRTHYREVAEEFLLIDNETLSFEAIPEEDWEEMEEMGENAELTAWLYPSSETINYQTIDFEILINGEVCEFEETTERSSGGVELDIYLPGEDKIHFYVCRKPCGGGNTIVVNYYKNETVDFNVTVKGKYWDYIEIPDEYLTSKLSIINVRITENEGKIKVPTNFKNGIIKVNRSNSSYSYPTSVNFGSDSYFDSPRKILNIATGKSWESSEWIEIAPFQLLIYVDDTQLCYLMNPKPSSST